MAQHELVDTNEDYQDYALDIVSACLLHTSKLIRVAALRRQPSSCARLLRGKEGEDRHRLAPPLELGLVLAQERRQGSMR